MAVPAAHANDSMSPAAAPAGAAARADATAGRAIAPATPATSGPPAIHVRSPKLDFANVPRHWFANSIIGTAFANGLNLLFPAGERFFVRSVRRYLDRIDDPKLREDVKGFSGQEGLHAYAHERYFERLEEQGFDVKLFLKFYEAFAYGFVEKIAPAQLCLAATAACEHFTATMASNALAREADGSLVLKEPTMRALMLWHAMEEIEHRAVAFDVLQKVNPSYELRVAGLAVATTLLFGLWTAGTCSLLAQERLKPKRYAKELRARREFRAQHRVPDFKAAMLAYLRRDFHPLQDKECDELARAYGAAAGLA
jgi:predicted metal-dependent hydrolase